MELRSTHTGTDPAPPAHGTRPRRRRPRRAGIEADRALRHDRSAATLLTSDLVRARQTAEIIGARLRLDPRDDARLREQALGWLEGRGVDEAIASTADSDFCDPDASIGGGESARDVYERMTAILGELCPDQTTIVVSHGDALRYALGWVTGKPVEDCGWVEFLPGGVAAADAVTAPRWLPTREHRVCG